MRYYELYTLTYAIGYEVILRVQPNPTKTEYEYILK